MDMYKFYAKYRDNLIYAIYQAVELCTKDSINSSSYEDATNDMSLLHDLLTDFHDDKMMSSWRKLNDEITKYGIANNKPYLYPIMNEMLGDDTEVIVL